jgi:hypothetical protein
MFANVCQGIFKTQQTQKTKFAFNAQFQTANHAQVPIFVQFVKIRILSHNQVSV